MDSTLPSGKRSDWISGSYENAHGLRCRDADCPCALWRSKGRRQKVFCSRFLAPEVSQLLHSHEIENQVATNCTGKSLQSGFRNGVGPLVLLNVSCRIQELRKTLEIISAVRELFT